jgi:hypothetical protein
MLSYLPLKKIEKTILYPSRPCCGAGRIVILHRLLNVPQLNKLQDGQLYWGGQHRG